MTYDIDELLRIAQEAVEAGIIVHRKGFGRSLSVQAKSSELDLVSEIDIETERVMIAYIGQKRPEDEILSEESGSRPGKTGVRWILDPLDGTTNYLYGYPAFGIALGVEIDGHGAIGVIADTYHDRLYLAAIDREATCNGKSIAVSTCTRLETALIGTGFLPNRTIRRQQGEVLTEILPQVRDIRRSGSPILDLCAVASGNTDGFYEFGLAPWDIAAGTVIARAAGARVTILHQKSASPLTIASSPGIHDELLELVSSAWDRFSDCTPPNGS